MSSRPAIQCIRKNGPATGGMAKLMSNPEPHITMAQLENANAKIGQLESLIASNKTEVHLLNIKVEDLQAKLAASEKRVGELETNGRFNDNNTSKMKRELYTLKNRFNKTTQLHKVCQAAPEMLSEPLKFVIEQFAGGTKKIEMWNGKAVKDANLDKVTLIMENGRDQLYINFGNMDKYNGGVQVGPILTLFGHKVKEFLGNNYLLVTHIKHRYNHEWTLDKKDKDNNVSIDLTPIVDYFHEFLTTTFNIKDSEGMFQRWSANEKATIETSSIWNNKTYEYNATYHTYFGDKNTSMIDDMTRKVNKSKLEEAKTEIKTLKAELQEAKTEIKTLESKLQQDDIKEPDNPLDSQEVVYNDL
jgi:chromosome segregation ATPase